MRVMFKSATVKELRAKLVESYGKNGYRIDSDGDVYVWRFSQWKRIGNKFDMVTPRGCRTA